MESAQDARGRRTRPSVTVSGSAVKRPSTSLSSGVIQTLAASRYLTSDARLEPTKSVADYFKDSHLPYWIQVLLEWTTVSWREYMARAEAEHVKHLTLQREKYDKLLSSTPVMMPAPAPTMTKAMRLVACIVDACDPAISVFVTSRPEDTIAKMLDHMIQELVKRNEPHD